MSVHSYVTRIKNLYALLETSGLRNSEEEKVEIMLAGLPLEFEPFVSSTSLSTGLLSFQRLINALVECESRQSRAVQELSFYANLVKPTSSPVMESFVRGGRSSSRGHGWSFRPRIQCQIYSRFGHIAQQSYYRYHRNSDPSSLPPIVHHDDQDVSRVFRALAPLFSRDDQVLSFGRSTDEWVYPRMKTPRVSYYLSAGQNQFFVDQNSHCLGQNLMYELADYGYGQPAREPLGLLNNVPKPVTNAPSTVGNEFGQVRRDFGCDFGQPLVVPYRHRPPTPQPTTNNVQVDPSWGLGQNARLLGGVSVPWHTKPRARVYSSSDLCIGLPRVGDLHVSDFSNTSASGTHVNTKVSAPLVDPSSQFPSISNPSPTGSGLSPSDSPPTGSSSNPESYPQTIDPDCFTRSTECVPSLSPDSSIVLAPVNTHPMEVGLCHLTTRSPRTFHEERFLKVLKKYSRGAKV
ncbi:hypothetical protein PVK06_029842 [Gossypium arboreum]|uniref:Uncharacterized protein n=1 Tax=Gossypium arboreum TaxID=29729 RepID=A0ABR0NLN8_GOSAR|nr:hypothetical protein PVK06_029842 [Gossypium arboreum]